MFRKKITFRTNYSSIFSSKVQDLTVFSVIYVIRIRFFGSKELTQRTFRAAQYLGSTKRATKKEVDFATLMAPQECGVGSQITKVQRQSIVKDHDGACAVFTEQGSSASQMTAAIVMTVIARLPDWDGQAVDAVSAYTQVKLEDAPRLLNIPQSECPVMWIRLPRHRRPKSWASIEDHVVPLERHLHGHPLAGLLWERQFEEELD